MNAINTIKINKEIKVNVNFVEEPVSKRNENKFIELNNQLTYKAFLAQFLKSEITNHDKNYLILLKDSKGEKIIVDKNSFNQVKERVLGQIDEGKEDYFIVLEQDKISLQTKDNGSDDLGKFFKLKFIF